MRKKWLYLAVGGGAFILIASLVILLATPGPDISGKYELLIAGQSTETVVEINNSGDSFIVKLMEKDKTLSEYTLPKPRGSRFVIDKTADGKPGDRYDLEVTDKGLKGKADIATMAKGIEVFFRKIP